MQLLEHSTKPMLAAHALLEGGIGVRSKMVQQNACLLHIGDGGWSTLLLFGT